MLKMHENATHYIAETPAEGFAFYEDALAWAENVSEGIHVDHYDGGDELILSATYINPEGEQLDVDRFRATCEALEVLVMFDDELPED